MPSPRITLFYRLPAGGVQGTFPGVARATYTVLFSPDLTQWDVLGTATETDPGQFEFTDASNTELQQSRFYKLRSP